MCGRNSFFTSGAENLIKKLNHKETRFFYKKSEIPILEELIEIINEIKSFKADLFLAIGGGAIIDYAKMANVVDSRPDLSKLILNYSYPFKKKYTQNQGFETQVTLRERCVCEKVAFHSIRKVPNQFVGFKANLQHSPILNSNLAPATFSSEQKQRASTEFL